MDEIFQFGNQMALHFQGFMVRGNRVKIILTHRKSQALGCIPSLTFLTPDVNKRPVSPWSSTVLKKKKHCCRSILGGSKERQEVTKSIVFIFKKCVMKKCMQSIKSVYHYKACGCLHSLSALTFPPLLERTVNYRVGRRKNKGSQ